MSALPVEETTDLIRIENQIESSLRTAYDGLIEIRDRKLYAETHATFESYCLERWNISRQRAYQLINAAEIAKDIHESHKHASGILSTKVDKIPETHIRPLVSLPKPERVEAYREAAAKSEGKLTAKTVQEVVDRRIGKPPKQPKPAQTEPIIEQPTGQSKVNGVLQPDPPQVAEMRRSGKIPATVIPEIETSADHTTVADVAADRDERKGKQEDDLSDGDWLATLPIHAKLSGSQLKTFEEDALLYRRIGTARLTFVRILVREANKCRRKGPFSWAARRFLKIDDPRRWLLCPNPESGGCGGSGQIPLIGGDCPKCRGKGYRINND